jgi:hypothetical protein
LTFPGFLVAILKGTENLSYSIGKLLKLKTTQYRIIGWILILLYIIIGFVATAEKNIAFPTTTDKSIAKLFPDGYDKNLWGDAYPSPISYFHSCAQRSRTFWKCELFSW